MANKFKHVCTTCGSENVLRDAWAWWNPETQQFELENVFDDTYCEDCDASCKVDVEALWYRDLTADEDEIIQIYAEYHGKDWKEHLAADWSNGKDIKFRDGHLLRRIRNELGPEWLEQYEVAA